MTESEVDIPDPETAPEPPARDTSAYDPGGDLPGLDDEGVPDPAYDPGGIGRQPDFVEEDDRR